MNGAELFESIKTATFAELAAPLRAQHSKRGNLFEKSWDLAIKLGLCALFPNSEWEHHAGNLNTGSLKPVDSLARHLAGTRVFGKGAGGASDITLRHRASGRWAFISAKFFSDDKRKAAADYDVGAIMAAAGARAHQYPAFDVYLLVHDKAKVRALMRASQATSDHITTRVCAMLDAEDLELCLAAARVALAGVPLEALDARFGATKVPLALRFHQELITHKQMLLVAGGARDLLLGAKARSGKTYCVGGLFAKFLAARGALNALVITPAPSETLSQFTDDMFRRFGDFADVNVLEARRGADLAGLELAPGSKNIVIASKQLLDGFTGAKAVRALAELPLDFIVFDENHFGGTTARAKDIMRAYRAPNTVALYLTATYAKPLAAWAVPAACQHFWDIEDEQLCKRRDLAGLAAKHGPEAALFVDAGSAERVLGVYDSMPDLHVITTMMDGARYAAIKSRIADTSYGFSNSALLALASTKAGSGFLWPAEVDMLLTYIGGQGPMAEGEAAETPIAPIVDPIRDSMAVFERVRAISAAAGSRTGLCNGDFCTQLWFLPVGGAGSRIDTLSAALAARMRKNRALAAFDVMIVNSKKEYALVDVKAAIRDRELRAKADGRAGLILLAGSQLSLGITLPHVDVVMLLNDTLSCDKVVQTMYRCMTEAGGASNELNTGLKKMGFVVDLNMSRVLNTLMDYEVRGASLTADKKIAYIVENSLMCIDADLFRGRENQSKLIERLVAVWRADPVNHLRVLLRKIEETALEMDTVDQRALNAHFSASLGDKRVNVAVAFDEASPEALAAGLVVAREGDAASDASGETVASEASAPVETDISLTKDVLPFLIPLSCILTIRDDNRDFAQMLALIKASPELLAVFRDQSLVWWSRADVIAMVERMVEKYVRKDSRLYDIAVQFKMSLLSLIDKPVELLELIDTCLKPKEIEKKKFGEVFTPLAFINDKMLADLEAHYNASHEVPLYEDETLTWADTTAGMGNFPVAIYYKLMVGLSRKIPEEASRKKHILEKMLYMAEYNAKNCFVVSQIFNIHGNYKLNLYQGDSLALDIEKTFGIPKFDVVIGNPPYNEELKTTGAAALYNKFVEKYIDKCALLCFVIPSRWFVGGKGLDKFRAHMLTRTDIAYIKHFDDASKIFGNGVSIEGGVNYFLKDSGHCGDCAFDGVAYNLAKYDCIINPAHHALIDKTEHMESIESIYMGRYFGVETNDMRLRDAGETKCFVSLAKSKDRVKFIDGHISTEDTTFWKVITPEANGKSPRFGVKFVGAPEEIHTGSYISFRVGSAAEAASLISYLDTKFANYMLSVRKISQHIHKDTCKWIPLVPLNREWTDVAVCEYLNIEKSMYI